MQSSSARGEMSAEHQGILEGTETKAELDALVPNRSRDIRAHPAPLIARLLRGSTVRASIRVSSLVASDFLAIGLALYGWLSLKASFKGDYSWDLVSRQVWTALPLVFVVAVLLFAKGELYNERAHRPGLPRIASALFQTTVVALVFALASGDKFNTYAAFVGSLVFAIVTVSAFRSVHDRATARLISAAGVARRVVVVGRGAHADSVVRALSGSTRWPVEIVGDVTPPEDLTAVVARGGIDEVVLAETDFPEDMIVDLADRCHRLGIEVNVAPTTMEILLQRAEFRPGMPLPLFRLAAPTFGGLDFLVKRTFDILGASLTLILLSPVLLICALAVKFSSKGPVIYKSVRPGMGEKWFACLKFRTMYIDADQRIGELEDRNEASGALFKMKDDPRVTKIGKIMRRYSIDELPQLWNVLRGEMSLVGPRPLPLRDYKLLTESHRLRYQVLPGMTGLWQVSERRGVDFDELVRLDFLYLESWSVGLDLLILLKTLPAVLSRRGVY